MLKYYDEVCPTHPDQKDLAEWRMRRQQSR